METQLKQRLVGITVIFALAVIFLPMILDGSGRKMKQLDIAIPPPPQISSPIKVEEKVIELKKQAASLPTLEPVIVDEISEPPETPVAADDKKPVAEVAPEPVKKEAQEKSPANTEQKKQPDSQPSKPEVQKPKPETKPLLGGQTYVIQVGSFQDKSKAYKERDRLRQSKLSAVFIERFVNNGIPSYRVRMGPFLSREKARIVNNKIRAKYNIEGLVMSYER